MMFMHVATSTIDTELTTVSRVARMLELSEGMVRRLADHGALPCIRVGSGLRLFKLADVERLRSARAALELMPAGQV